MGNAQIHSFVIPFFQNIPQESINVDSNIMQLTNLEMAFNLKLAEYKSAYAAYIEKKSTYDQMYYRVEGSGTQFVGKKPIATNLMPGECVSRCTADPNCLGMNYDDTTKMCTILPYGRGGYLQKNLTTDKFFIGKMYNKAVVDLKKLESINQELIDINKQILVVINQTQPSHYVNNENPQTIEEELQAAYPNDNMNILFKNDKILFNNNQTLMQEREKIRQTLEEYNDANTEFSNRSIDVEQKNASYNIWLVIMIIFVCILFKLFFFPESNNIITVRSSFWMVYIILFVIATLNLNNPIAFSIWLLLICVILAMKANLIPSI